jgi:hypothetical protein
MRFQVAVSDFRRRMLQTEETQRFYANPTLEDLGIQKLEIQLISKARVQLQALAVDGFYRDLVGVEIHDVDGKVIHMFEKARDTFRLPITDVMSAVSGDVLVLLL